MRGQLYTWWPRVAVLRAYRWRRQGNRKGKRGQVVPTPVHQSDAQAVWMSKDQVGGGEWNNQECKRESHIAEPPY